MPNESDDSPQPTGLTVESIVIAPAAQETELGRAYYLAEVQRFELDKLQITNDALRENAEHRGNWAKRVLPLCVLWLLAVIGILLLQGFPWFGFHLSDSVLIAFIGTTTVNVLGLGYIVANYLFPKQP